MLEPLIGYGLWCIVLAALNARYVKQDYIIAHWANGAAHISTALVFALNSGWEIFFVILCEARLVFTVALNIMSKGKFDYVTKTPKAWLDIAEQAVFKKSFWKPIIFYLILALLMLASYHKYKLSWAI